MKKLFLFLAVVLIAGCTTTVEKIDNSTECASCPIDSVIVATFDERMSDLRDSIAIAQYTGDTAHVVRLLLDWERMYTDYCYNAFRELNLRFHQDSVYQGAYHYIENNPIRFWDYAHCMQGIDAKGANNILNYLMWRSEIEIAKADTLPVSRCIANTAH